MSTFAPCLDVLLASQRDLWPELSRIRDQFILYGGTALALRLGHRASVDFVFFAFQPFDIEALRHSVPWIRDAEILQAQPNTLTVLHHDCDYYTSGISPNAPISDVQNRWRMPSLRLPSTATASRAYTAPLLRSEPGGLREGVNLV
jgi:hypothetical protein